MKRPISDKEYIIKTNKATTPKADILSYYYEQENGSLVRSREKVIGNTVYTVISREKTNADTTTAFDITKRLIERNIDEVLKPSVRLSHKQSLGSCNSGGNKQ